MISTNVESLNKEIDEPTLEAHAETIFTQAENRLHSQKATLLKLAGLLP